MKKRWLSSLVVCLLLGCSGGHDDIELIKHVSPLRDAPIPLDAPSKSLDPILADSIITLEEQTELIKVIESLLEELAYYKRMYYLQLLKK